MKAAITTVPGIGPATAEILAEHSITTVYRLSRTPVEKLAMIPGFSEARAARVIAAARELLDTPAEATSGEAGPQPPETGEKPASREHKAKKDKKGKKGKSKNKDKKKGKDKGKDKDKGKGKGKGKDKKKGKNKKGKDKKKGKK